jgi:hypothetical protein
MSQRPEFLKAEDAVSALLAELERLKSATDQIDEAKSRAQTVVDAAREVVNQTGRVVASAHATFKAIDDLDLADRMSAQELELKASAQREASLLDRLGSLSLELAGVKKLTVVLAVLSGVQVLALGILLILMLAS